MGEIVNTLEGLLGLNSEELFSLNLGSSSGPSCEVYAGNLLVSWYKNPFGGDDYDGKVHVYDGISTTLVDTYSPVDSNPEGEDYLKRLAFVIPGDGYYLVREGGTSNSCVLDKFLPPGDWSVKRSLTVTYDSGSLSSGAHPTSWVVKGDFIYMTAVASFVVDGFVQRGVYAADISGLSAEGNDTINFGAPIAYIKVADWYSLVYHAGKFILLIVTSDFAETVIRVYNENMVFEEEFSLNTRGTLCQHGDDLLILEYAEGTNSVATDTVSRLRLKPFWTNHIETVEVV